MQVGRLEPELQRQGARERGWGAPCRERPGLAPDPAPSLLGAHLPPAAGCHSLSTHLHVFLLSSVSREEPNS